MRSALTMLGIVIGVSSVVFLICFGRGHEANLMSIFQRFGTNSIYITSTSGLARLTGASRSLTMEDAEALENYTRAPSVAVVSPLSEKMSVVVYGNQKVNTRISACMPNIRFVTDYNMAEGIYIQDADASAAAQVAVLGATAATNLFKTEDPIGKTIRIEGKNFEVIGVLDAKGGFMAGADDFITIPLTTMQSKLQAGTGIVGRPIQTIAIAAVSPELVTSAKEEVISILRQRHHIREGEQDDFTVVDMREIIDNMRKALQTFQVFLASVGAISLVVGGIGIMNIMLVSVSERTREIGIRKALGAKRSDIIKQFLVESTLLSVSGGLIGMIFSFLCIKLITGVSVGGYTVQAPFSADVVVLAVTVAAVIGIFSGLYPAFRAARLDPVESLRYE